MIAIVTAPTCRATSGRSIAWRITGTQIRWYSVRPAAKTRWYRVQCGGYEPITYPDGTVKSEVVLDGFYVELPNTYLGLGTRDRIKAAALECCPGKAVLEFWPLRKPPADEL